jgi:hypothetical protein
MAVAAVMPAFGGTVSVNLGSASSFGLLGGTAISNTGTSLVTGYVGVQDAAATITGFYPTGTTSYGPPGVVAPGDMASTNAYIAFVNAYNQAISELSTQTYGDLKTDTTFLGDNVYTSTELGDISTKTGITLTFDAGGDPNNVFVIKTPAALTVNGAITFTLQNQAQANNIFWIIGTIATLSPASSGTMTFDGNILAGQAFTMSSETHGVDYLAGIINGCVFAETANTLAATTYVNGCSSTASSIPEPGSSGLVSLGCLLGILAWRKFRVSL